MDSGSLSAKQQEPGKTGTFLAGSFRPSVVQKSHAFGASSRQLFCFINQLHEMGRNPGWPTWSLGRVCPESKTSASLTTLGHKGRLPDLETLFLFLLAKLSGKLPLLYSF